MPRPTPFTAQRAATAARIDALRDRAEASLASAKASAWMITLLLQPARGNA